MKSYTMRVHEGVKFVVIPALESLNLVYHGFSTRVGGVSTGPFKSLDLGLSSGGDRDLVEINRCVFLKALGGGNPETYTVRQVHGTRVLRIDPETLSLEAARKMEADALMTDRPGVAIGVLTADCVPVLMVDPVNRSVAAVHAGRVGSLQSLVSRVLEAMHRDFGSSPQAIHAAVGPCIERDCYEISADMADAIDSGPQGGSALVQKENGVHVLDLRKMNHEQLRDAGVPEKQIYHADLCTACHPRTFYSYRRSQAKATGRMMAVIGIKAN